MISKKPLGVFLSMLACFSVAGCLGGDKVSSPEDVTLVSSTPDEVNQNVTSEEEPKLRLEIIEIEPWDAVMENYVATCLPIDCFSNTAILGQVANPSLLLPLGNITQAEFSMVWDANSPTTETFSLSVWAKLEEGDSIKWRPISNFTESSSPLSFADSISPMTELETAWLWIIPSATLDDPRTYVIPRQEFHVEGFVQVVV